MSAILAVCGDTFCAMVSDGRYVEEPITGEKPHILKNDLPKVRKINRNVVVGFAGDTLAAVQIINAVDEYQTQYLTLEKVVKILREKAATVSVQPVGVRLIVGGRNRKGVFTGFDNELLRAIADKHRATPAQVALAWALQRGFAVIPSSTQREHLASNLRAQDLALDAEDMAAIATLERHGREVNPEGLAPAWD